MLERFTEKARRVIFFARYEAAQYGSPNIETAHLLLGVAREDKGLFQSSGLTVNQIRRILENEFLQIRPRISGSFDFPLSKEVKQILEHAVSEADKLNQWSIIPGHLMLGILAESSELRKELQKSGLTEASVTDRIIKTYRGKTEFAEDSDYACGHSGCSIRSGIGYDLHRLEPGRKLRIGGIEVPFDKGPVGHSDGDVLVHAICDALLGAAGLGDIGTHFPDTDAKWKGADSLMFLKHVHELYEKDGLHIIHIDAIVIAERPKLGPHFPTMREALAGALGIKQDQINLKAKTNEGVDAIGRGEAIAAHAVATVTG